MSFDQTLIRQLESYGRVITAASLVESQQLTFRRDKEVDFLAKHLDRARQKSFLLVGPSGCGKSAILRQTIRQLASRRSKPWLFLETSTSLLMKDTKYLGEWQTRFHKLMDLVAQPSRVAIYFADVPNLTGAGRHSDSEENVASALAPHMQSGECVVLGELTEEQATGWLDRFPWFRNLFNLIQIAPLSHEDVEAVIRAVADQRNEALFDDAAVQLQWSAEALAATAHFGKLYFPGATPPAGAIRLIDHLVSTHRDQAQHRSRQIVTREVAYQDLVKTLESISGIPGRLLDDSRSLNLNDVKEFFQTRVIGQEVAVNTVVDLIALVKAGLTDPQKPMGVFLFVGPTGVGKTEMAKTLAEFIFGSTDRLVRYDMSEFKDYHSFEKLIGGTGSTASRTGSLLQRIRQQPFSVILLDEIEKAHANVFDLLLQLFDDGRLSDTEGQVTDFTQTIIVMTSNLGTVNADGAHFGFGPGSDGGEAALEAVKQFFRPELVNRIDRVITFRALEKEHVRTIAKRELGHVLMRSGITRRKLRIDVDRSVVDILAEAGFHPAFGARPLKRAVNDLVLLPIARHLAQMDDANRPALIRLLPSEKGITLKVIRDRQSRKSESIARGVQLTDPLDGTKTRLKPAQLQEQAQQLRDLVQSLTSTCQQRQLTEQRTALVEDSAAVDFWDHPREARETLDELYRIDRILQAVDQVRRNEQDATTQLDLAIQEKNERRLRRAAAQLRETLRHAEVVRFSLLCEHKLDRCDAFVAITAVEPNGDDNAGHLADMYAGWARSKGFRVVVAHEELHSRRVTREIVLLIEGIAVYGLLRRERGLHEFVSGKPSSTSRDTSFVKVHVLPIVDFGDVDSSQATVSTKRTRGAALRCERFQTEATAVDRCSGRQVCVRNGLSASEARTLVQDLLWAEYRCPTAEELEQDEVEVRRYALRPSQSAKDLRTKVTLFNLKDVWKGDIDQFLLAALELDG